MRLAPDGTQIVTIKRMGTKQTKLLVNNNGLSSRAILSELCLEEMARHADNLTRTISLNKQRLKTLEPIERRSKDKNIGNVAYLALYALEPYNSRYASELLDYADFTRIELRPYTKRRLEQLASKVY